MEFKALLKNSKALPKDRVLELDDGYYNMAYACHLVSNRAKYLISKDDKSIIFKNCIIISVSQISLNLMIGPEIFRGGVVLMTTYDVLLSRFFCSLVQHMLLIRDVYTTIKMVKFLTKHAPLFDN